MVPNKSGAFAGEVETFCMQIFRIHNPIIFSAYVDVYQSPYLSY
jgi:hypothetical protein